MITWDQRGHGGTRATGPFTYWDSAADVLAAQDALAASSRARDDAASAFDDLKDRLLRVSADYLEGEIARQEAEIARRLYPDQDTFKAEEQRRFELLDAHWDVPVERRPLE